MPKPPFLLTTAQMRRLSPHFPLSRVACLTAMCSCASRCGVCRRISRSREASHGWMTGAC